MANASKAPSGLAIARDNMKFAISWKVSESDGYNATHLHYKTNLDKDWISIDDQGTFNGTSKTVTLSAANYYPNTSKKLTAFSFRVRGRRRKSGYKFSGWVEKSLAIAAPAVPSLTATLSGTYSNITTFTWSAVTSTTDAKPFTNVEWQTRLIKENNETDGSKIAWNSNCSGWATGTAAASGSRAITEDTTLLAANAYTRWFRVRSRGPAGASAWRYAKHVYSTPFRAVVNSSTYTAVSGGSAVVSVTWTVSQSASHPIDSTMVQYAIATPTANQGCPSGASWTDAGVSKDTGGTDSAKFSISTIPGDDEILFARVATQHDDNITYSAAKIVQRGALSAPTGISVSADTSTYRATITATNRSDVPDSRLAVVFRTSQANWKDYVIGIIGTGETSVTVQCPDYSGMTPVSFGVYAFQGTATSSARADGSTQYAVTANQKSSTVWDGGSVPAAPSSVTAAASGDQEGEVLLTWSWDWEAASYSEISWSDNPNAWESTDEPTTYEISNLHAAKWRVSGLDMGRIWYFRVRLIAVNDGEENYGPYSDIVSVDLSEDPNVPVLTLSDPLITSDGSAVVSWDYVSNDGTPQAYAEICEATVSGGTVTYGDIIAHTTTAKSVTIAAAENEWQTGTVYYLCARVTAMSGGVSDWSDPVQVTVVDPIEINVSATSLNEITVEDDGGETRTVLALEEMPLTATIEGAGEGGTTTLVIERAEEYHVIRPDGSVLDGFEGEAVASFTQNGEEEITIDADDLIGRLDDGAAYRLVATISDGFGQTDTAEIGFEVHWEHQADTPTATAVIENGIAKISPVAPAGYVSGDFCDIYRLSIDGAELIVYGGSFGTTYVDPFPAIGEAGGHRVVHRTTNNDYITADDSPAWVDLGADDGDILDVDYAIIDFGDRRLEVTYNTDFNSDFEKDFEETRYLGGSIQGDWNPGATRKTTINAQAAADDLDLRETLRALAQHTGICHVRTHDGSSYAADVQVGDTYSYGTAGKIVSYSLTITRVDPEGYEGMTLEEWEEMNS